VRNVYIVSASMIKVDRYFNKSYKELVLDALTKILDEGSVEHIDYTVVSTLLSDSILHQLDLSTVLTQYLGLNPIPSFRVETGESSGLAAIELGFSLIASGKADSVLVVGVEKLTEYPTNIINENYSRILDYEIETIRNISPPDYAALIMKEYMKRYKIKREELTIWPIKMHDNALRNPHAQLRFRVDVDKVLNSITIAEPIKLLDTFPIGDGSAIILLGSERVLRRSNSECMKVTYITSSTSQPIYLRDDILEFTALRKAFKTLYEGSRLDLEETLLEIHDSYSIYAYLILEELGIAPRGKAPNIVDELGNVNLSGGLKARGHPFGATGIYQVAEAYSILSDKGLGELKYNGRYGLIHSMSGPDYNSRLCLIEKVM